MASFLFSKKGLHNVDGKMNDDIEFTEEETDMNERFDHFLLCNSVRIINSYKKHIEEFDSKFLKGELLQSIDDIKSSYEYNDDNSSNNEKEKMMSFYIDKFEKNTKNEESKYKEVLLAKKLIERDERTSRLKKYNELHEIYDELKGKRDYYTNLNSEMSRNKANFEDLKERNENNRKRLLTMNEKIKELEGLKIKKDELLSKKERFTHLRDRYNNLQKQLDLERQLYERHLKKDIGLEMATSMFRDVSDLEKERISLLEIYRKKKSDLIRKIQMCKEDVCKIGELLEGV